MTHSTLHAHLTTMTPTTALTTNEQFAQRVVAHLDAAARNIPHNASERLRFARERALDAQKLMGLETAAAVQWQRQAAISGSLASDMGGAPHGSRFNFDSFGKWGSFIPLIALVTGLFAITHFQSDQRAKEIAEIDSALLTDDLPPAAYADQGFGLFLKQQSEE